MDVCSTVNAVLDVDDTYFYNARTPAPPISLSQTGHGYGMVLCPETAHALLSRSVVLEAVLQGQYLLEWAGRRHVTIRVAVHSGLQVDRVW
jgi:hypothetical protein